MFKCTALFILLVTISGANAQELYRGTLDNPKDGISQVIFYSVTESRTDNVYQSAYSVFNAKKALLYTITLVNNKYTNKLAYEITSPESSEEHSQFYDPVNSGLFFSDHSDMDTAISTNIDFDNLYTHIFSFADTGRKSPFIHKLITTDGKILSLDEISPKRLARHKGYIENILGLQALQHEKGQAEKAAIARANDSLAVIKKTEEIRRNQEQSKAAAFNAALLDKAVAFYNSLDQDTARIIDIYNNVATGFDSLKFLLDNYGPYEKYAGARKHGVKNGHGLLVESSRLFYYGRFANDSIATGLAVIDERPTRYIGEMASGQKNGYGILQTAPGNYLLGYFTNEFFVSGIKNWRESNGKHYFGEWKNKQMNGFGEDMESANVFYIGEFSKGILKNGYSLLNDKFGNQAIGKIENGIKSDSAIAGRDFFAAIDSLKKGHSLSTSGYSAPGEGDTLTTLPISLQAQALPKRKYKVPNFFGVSIGATIPLFGFENSTGGFGYYGPKIALDGWFRFANAIGFKTKFTLSSYSVSNNYTNYINSEANLNTKYRYEMLWLVHSYDIGLGLNLGGRKGSLELSAMGGLSVQHQPLYDYINDQMYWDKARVSWNVEGELAVRINCSKHFGFRFGATYFFSPAYNFMGYDYDNTGFVEQQKLHAQPTTIIITSVDPFISFVGLF